VLADYRPIPIIIYLFSVLIIKSSSLTSQTALRVSKKSYYCVTHYRTTVFTWKQVEAKSFQFPKFIIDFRRRIVGVTSLRIGEKALFGISR